MKEIIAFLLLIGIGFIVAQAPSCPNTNDDRITYLPNADDCSRYWECFKGNRYLMKCPPGLYWNQAVSQCDYPNNVPSCSSGSSSSLPSTLTSPSTDPSTPSIDPQCPYPSDRITYFPVPGDCTKFYLCYAGVKTIKDCPSGLYWHQEISECDYPQNTNCRPGY